MSVYTNEDKIGEKLSHASDGDELEVVFEDNERTTLSVYSVNPLDMSDDVGKEKEILTVPEYETDDDELIALYVRIININKSYLEFDVYAVDMTHDSENERQINELSFLDD